ncbi:MAG: hypothetical protein QOD88_2210 [Mycobacterium sp.]|jgi:Mrp family chromosome partitioning ATPase|nr:hypothetical protein [Mycobacterium sp.]MDT5229601.1 hypothetical protein [Mycobacterium sp.]MDT5319688.1 hypothetical protein [Mycobacterium sp.]
MTSEVLLLAGRSGVGKSSVAFGCHDALRAAGVRHCVIDGDMLDMAYPTPWNTYWRNAIWPRCGPITVS